MVKILTGKFAGCVGVISNKDILVYCGSDVIGIRRDSVEYVDHLSDAEMKVVDQQAKEEWEEIKCLN